MTNQSDNVQVFNRVNDFGSNQSELDRKIDALAIRYDCDGKFRHSLLALMIEVRVDEIATIPLEHGRRTTCTYVNGKQQTIESRYAELRTKLAEWEIKDRV